MRSRTLNSDRGSRHSNAGGVVDSSGERGRPAHGRPQSTWLPHILVLTAILLAIGAILHFVRPAARPPPAEESLLLRSTGAPKRAPDVDSLAKHVEQSGGDTTAAAIAAARSAGVHVVPAAPRLDVVKADDPQGEAKQAYQRRRRRSAAKVAAALAAHVMAAEARRETRLGAEGDEEGDGGDGGDGVSLQDSERVGLRNI